MWYRMMVIAFLTNGLGAFGIRMLSEIKWGESQTALGSSHAYLYLAFWYLAGFIFATADLFFAGDRKLHLREVVMGGLAGLCSSCGWIFLTFAVASGIQGFVAFPIAIGGSLSIVALVGVLFFKEKLSRFGYAGILCGVLAIVVLATA